MAEKYPERVIVRLSKRQKADLEEEAKQQKKTLSEIIRRRIEGR